MFFIFDFYHEFKLLFYKFKYLLEIVLNLKKILDEIISVSDAASRGSKNQFIPKSVNPMHSPTNTILSLISNNSANDAAASNTVRSRANMGFNLLKQDDNINRLSETENSFVNTEEKYNNEKSNTFGIQQKPERHSQINNDVKQSMNYQSNQNKLQSQCFSRDDKAIVDACAPSTRSNDVVEIKEEKVRDMMQTKHNSSSDSNSKKVGMKVSKSIEESCSINGNKISTTTNINPSLNQSSSVNTSNRNTTTTTNVAKSNSQNIDKSVNHRSELSKSVYPYQSQNNQQTYSGYNNNNSSNKQSHSITAATLFHMANEIGGGAVSAVLYPRFDGSYNVQQHPNVSTNNTSSNAKPLVSNNNGSINKHNGSIQFTNSNGVVMAPPPGFSTQSNDQVQYDKLMMGTAPPPGFSSPNTNVGFQPIGQNPRLPFNKVVAGTNQVFQTIPNNPYNTTASSQLAPSYTLASNSQNLMSSGEPTSAHQAMLASVPQNSVQQPLISTMQPNIQAVQPGIFPYHHPSAGVPYPQINPAGNQISFAEIQQTTQEQSIPIDTRQFLSQQYQQGLNPTLHQGIHSLSQAIPQPPPGIASSLSQGVPNQVNLGSQIPQGVQTLPIGHGQMTHFQHAPFSQQGVPTVS